MSVPADLRADLEIVWAVDTSADPARWDPFVPSTGHADVTALIVNALFGGDLVYYDLNTHSHYANFIDDELVDLTIDQYGDAIEQFDEIPYAECTREFLIMDDGVFGRFTVLSDRLKKLWGSRQSYLRLVVNG